LAEFGYLIVNPLLLGLEAPVRLNRRPLEGVVDLHRALTPSHEELHAASVGTRVIPMAATDWLRTPSGYMLPRVRYYWH
jgi:hypothetical protein